MRTVCRLKGHEDSPMNRRRNLGTTLIEVLVAIVVLLVGILAVVQIFPGGFRILTYARNNAMATQLARDEIERLKSRSDQLPEEILAITYPNVGGTPLPIVDANRRPADLGPVTNNVTALGVLLTDAGGVAGEWTRNSGPNVFRRIINEGVPMTPPRMISSNLYGMLSIAAFGPMERLLSVKGPNLNVRRGTPEESMAFGEVFIDRATDGNPQITLPMGNLPYSVLIRFTGFVDTAGTINRQVFRDVVISVPTGTAFLYTINLATGDAGNPNPLGLGVGQVLRGFDPAERFDVALRYVPVPAFTNDPFEFRVLDEENGVLLFNPRGYNLTLSTPSGRIPLRARLSYDVRDWRVLKEEFRIADGDPPRYRLPVGNIKVGNMPGPDGLPLRGILGSEGSIATSSPGADHFVLVDLETGGLFYEQWDGRPVISLDKTNGAIVFGDTNLAQAGFQGVVRLPDGTPREVNLITRSVRALFMANNEWAVQVLKAADLYTQSLVRPGNGEYYVGGSGALGGSVTRLYFSPSDTGRKVQVGTIYYRRAGDTQPRALRAQDFLVQGTRLDGLGLPYVDLLSVDPEAVGFDTVNGFAAREVRSGSVAVRVLWNPERFGFVGDPAQNLERIEQWARNWRRTTVETYLTAGEQN